MQLLYLLGMLVSIFFAVHAGKTGRYYWIFILIFFSPLGSIIYFFVEYYPEVMASNAKIRKLGQPYARQKNIKALERELEISDTVQNKINLAEAYFEKGLYEKSITLLESCLNGPYAKDPHVLEGLFYGYFCLEQHDQAMHYYNAITETANGKLSEDITLTKAKILEAQGESDKALETYASIVRTYPGEEARCRYAMLLKHTGQQEKANEYFREIIKKAKLYPKQYKKLYKKWVEIAKSEIDQ